MSSSKPPSCPICSRPRTEQYAPFCSKRCADVDLHRWFESAYAVPAVEDDGDAEDTGEANRG